MGTRGREIVDLDVDEPLRLLDAALASEWLACDQYWLGAKLSRGTDLELMVARGSR